MYNLNCNTAVSETRILMMTYDEGINDGAIALVARWYFFPFFSFSGNIWAYNYL